MEEINSTAKKRMSRAERREKQRLANHDRALKMRKARLQAQKDGLVSVSQELDRSIHIGCSGWFYWHWRGGFYPEGSSTSEWFSIYQKNFKTVELNAPFYSWPTTTAVKGWIRQAKTKNFLYTVKVFELITHVKKFTGTKTLIKDFGYLSNVRFTKKNEL